MTPAQSVAAYSYGVALLASGLALWSGATMPHQPGHIAVFNLTMAAVLLGVLLEPRP